MRNKEKQTLFRSEKKICSIKIESDGNVERQIIYVSDAMHQVINMAQLAARFADTNVLITGESGTGKENVARLIHQESARKRQKFCSINTAAIPDTLLESEFFGHKKGAFTGAVTDHQGIFSEANKGTLFLDEIGDMPIELQSKILRAVEEKRFTRIGENHQQESDFRVISATNQHIAELVEKRQFRLDLFHRLNTLLIHIPPLRERKEDIPPMIEYFIAYFCSKYKVPVPKIDDEVKTLAMEYPYPGNARELKNLCERGLILSNGGPITVKHVMLLKKNAKGIINSGNTLSFQEVLHLSIEDDLDEKQQIERALKKWNGNQSAAARALGIGRMTLARRIKKYGL